MAKAKNEAKIRFTAETEEYNDSIKKANDEMSKFRAEMKLNEAEMQATGKSAETLENKHRILAEQLEQSENKTEALRQKLAKAKEIFGENSTEARKLETQLLNAETAEVKLKSAVSDAEYELERFNKGLEDASEKSKEASDGFTVMKGALADLVADGISNAASGLAEIGTEAFTMANDVDKATNDFIAKTGESAEAGERFEDVMTDIYNDNFGESFEDIADAMATVKTAMGDIGDDELKKITTDAIILRDTFDMDVNESIRAVNSMMDQFGITADEAYSLIAQGAQNGLNQNDDLLDTVNEYSVQFKDAGYSAEDMFNMLANGVESGTWSVDKLGDAVKEFNIRMNDGSAKDAVEALGFSWESVSEAWSKGGDEAKDIFNMLFNELDGLENETEWYSVGVGLLGTMYEDLGQDAVLALSNTNGEISKSKDALKELNEVKYNDIGSAIEGIKRNLMTSVSEPLNEDVLPKLNEFITTVDWESVGQNISNGIRAGIDAITAFANGIKASITWMKEHKGVVIAVASVIGVLAAAITAYNVVQGIKTAMDAAQVTTVWGLVAAHWAQATAAMAAIAPYVLVVAAIAAVIAIIVLCVKYWDEIVAAVKKAWEAIKETLSVWGEWIDTNVIQPMIQFFSGLWDDIISACSAAWEWVKGIFSSFVKWVDTSVIQPVVNFFVGLWEKMKEIWDTICNVIKVALMLIGSIISAAVDIITLPFRFIWENCKEYVFAAWEWIKEKVSTAIQAVKTVIQNAMNAIKNVFSKIWNTIKKIFSTVFEVIKTIVTTYFNIYKTIITTVFNAIKSVVTTVWNAIKSVITTVVNAIKSTVTTVWNAIKSAITTAMNAVKNTVSSIWNGIKSTTSSIWNGIKSTISNVWNGIKDGVSNAINGVKNTVSSVFNGIKSTATSIWNGIKNAIISPIETAKEKVRGIVDSIKGFFNNMHIDIPHIKLPHISISGKLSLNPPQVPHLSIDWYKDGGIFTKPTIFSTATGLKGVGEAGAEAVLPIEKLEGYISGAIEKAQNVVNLGSLASAIEDLASRPVELYVGDRQIALATASASDNVNGLRNTFRSRGLVLD